MKYNVIYHRSFIRITSNENWTIKKTTFLYLYTCPAIKNERSRKWQLLCSRLSSFDGKNKIKIYIDDNDKQIRILQAQAVRFYFKSQKKF